MSKTRLIEAVKSLDFETTKQILEAKPSLLTVTDRGERGLLHLACSASSPKLNLVNFLLDRGLDIEAPIGRDRCTVLFFAVARARNAALVKLLLKRGAQAASAPGGGLFAAGWWEDLDILDILLKAGSPIDVVVGVTPFLACWNWRRFEAAKFLTKKGADINHQERHTGKTALHYGVEREFDPALLRWLVQHGAAPDIEDHQGVTARLRASRKRNKKFIEAIEVGE